MVKKVGIGIIGTGFARRVQIPGFLACRDAAVVSVASGSLENAKAAAGQFGIEHFTSEWRETVAREDVDLVCITTPPNLHREMTLAAAAHGKHILCEKPMAMNVDEAEEMLSAAKEAGVLALIDHELRFQPGRQRAFAMLREGAIGKIRHAKYLFQASYRANASLPWTWWSDIEQGGGALGAINSHVVDSLRWFLGAEVSSVFCQLQTQVKRRPYDGGFREVTTDDEANILLRFENGELTDDATGIVSVSMVEGPVHRNCVEFHGTEGAIRVEDAGELFIAKTGDENWQPVDVETVSVADGMPDTGFPRGFMSFAPKIVDAIANGESSVDGAATFEDGVAIQKVLDAARLSDNEGRRVELSY